MKSNTKKEILLIILVLAIVIGFRYHQYMIDRNFVLNSNVSCAPGEACFVAECAGDDEAKDSPDCDATPYKKITILAKDAPQCVEEHSCESFSCNGIGSCEVILCSAETIDEGEMCVVDLPLFDNQVSE